MIIVDEIIGIQAPYVITRVNICTNTRPLDIFRIGKYDSEGRDIFPVMWLRTFID